MTPEAKTPFEGWIVATLESVQKSIGELQDRQGEHMQTLYAKLDTINGKVRKTENDLSFMKGKAAGVGGLVAAIVSVIITLIARFWK